LFFRKTQTIERDKNFSHLLHIDAYSGDLNFVFVEAYKGGRVAAIYLPRLTRILWT